MKKLLLLLLCVPMIGLGQDNLKLILPIGHTDEILDFVYSSDENRLITVDGDLHIKMWDVPSTKLIHNFDLEGVNMSSETTLTSNLLLTSDDQRLIISKDSGIAVIDLQNMRNIYSLEISAVDIKLSVNERNLIVFCDNINFLKS